MNTEFLIAQLTDVINLLDEFALKKFEVFTDVSYTSVIRRFSGKLQESLSILNNDRIKTGGGSPSTNLTSIKSNATNHYDSAELLLSCTEVVGLLQSLKEEITNSIDQKAIDKLQSAIQLLSNTIRMKRPKTMCLRNIEEEQDFNIIRLIGDVVYLCKTLIVSEDVSLKLQIDPLVPDIVWGNPTQLSKLLLHVLGNRIKKSLAGTINLSLTVEQRTSNKDKIAFSISEHDNLSDIALADFKKHPPLLIDVKNEPKQNVPFFLESQIIKDLGGEILIRGKLGKWSSLQFILPFNFGNKFNAAKFTNTENFQQAATSLIKGTVVLVIDDNNLNQPLLKQRLCAWGCNILIAKNGSQGLSMLQENKVDIVIIDLQMRLTSGYELTSTIRKSRKYDAISIIAASDHETHFTELGRLGFNDLIIKPFSSDELLLKLVSNKKGSAGNKNSITARVLPSAMEHWEVDRLNLDYVLDECLGQTDLFEELIKLYHKNILEFIGRMKLDLKKADYENLDFSIHKVKLSLKMLKSNDLLQIVEQMDSCLRFNRDLKHMQFLYNCFLKEYPMVLDQLAAEINRLER